MTVGTQPHNKLIVVYIEDHLKTILLLRAARRRAQEKQCSWRAIYIETPSTAPLAGDTSRERMLRFLTLAAQMGGETDHIEAENTSKGLNAFLEKEKSRLELFIIGSVQTEGREYWLRTPPWVKIARIASNYAQVEIIPLTGQPYTRNLIERLNIQSIRPEYGVYALLAVGIASVCVLALQWLLPPALFRINDQNVGLVFMIACAFVAGRYGLMPGLISSLASFLTVNYFFTLPYYELKINTVTDALNMALFLSAALLISLFTSRARSYAHKAATRERSTQALFTLYRTTSEAHSREEALQTLQQRLEDMLDMHVAFFLPSILYANQVEPAYPLDLDLNEQDKIALQTCWNEFKTTGIGSSFSSNAAWRFEPMVAATGEVGILGVRPKGRTRLDPWFGRLLAAIADQTAAVLQHIGLERSMEETRLREEREKLRSMLLSSVSHDFKTPLAGIIGALSVYRSLGHQLSQQKRTELIETAIEEAQRLDNFITNILDMTRLESGNIQFRKEWHSMEDMLENVTRRMQPRCKQHKLAVHPCPANIEVCMDVLMTEQVIQNLLDNACKYTPQGTRIDISCRVDATKGLLCELRDHGPGIPSEKLNSIFDKYTRLKKRDSQIAGTGLGLAIARSVMEAQGGWITATNHPEGGALFTLCLPQWRRNTVSMKSNEEDEKSAPYKQAYSSH